MGYQVSSGFQMGRVFKIGIRDAQGKLIIGQEIPDGQGVLDRQGI